MELQNLIELIFAGIGFASVIVRMTPTTKDDAVLSKIKSFISKWIALNPDNTIKIKVK